MELKVGGLDDPQVISLLTRHLEIAAKFTPVYAIHALNLDALKADDMTFLSAWEDGVLAGFGALKELSPEHGEIKSMRTDDRFQRRGVSRLIMEELMELAAERSYERVSLETGVMNAYAPARALYRRFGFVYCPPFGSYKMDEWSVFMTCRLRT